MHVVVLGGWARSLVLFRGPLLQALVARGHRVTAMAADETPEVRARLGDMGVAFEPLLLERAGVNPFTDLRTLASLTWRLHRLHPDVVFGYTIKPVIYGNLAARLARVPHRYAMITGLGYTFQGKGLRRESLRYAAASLYRVALTGADALFLQNHDDARDLAVVGAIPRQLPVCVVRGSGVDLEHYSERPLPPWPLRFLFVGRLLREKGFLEFIELARRIRADHPDIRFQVVGGIDPNPTSVDRATVEAWNADGLIDYAGELDDIRPALAANHVLVLPSYREGTPRSVLEAMSTGRPTIVTDVPGSRDTIVDGVHGLIVPPRDDAALAAAAGRLIADPSLAVAMGARARQRAIELYDARRVASEMIEVMKL